jgi:hypothetical protein
MAASAAHCRLSASRNVSTSAEPTVRIAIVVSLRVGLMQLAVHGAGAVFSGTRQAGVRGRDYVLTRWRVTAATAAR